MPNPIRPLSFTALVLAAPIALLSACTGPDSSSSAGSEADPGRGAFESVLLPSDSTSGADPLILAQELYGATEPVEGNFSERVETLSSSDQLQVLLFTQLGLPDDSVRGTRHRLEFEPRAGLWTLTWAGRQVSCWPGRGHEDWSTQPCQ